MKGWGYEEDIVTCHDFHVPCGTLPGWLKPTWNLSGFTQASATHDRHSGFAQSLCGCLIWHCCRFGVPMLGYVCIRNESIQAPILDFTIITGWKVCVMVLLILWHLHVLWACVLYFWLVLTWSGMFGKQGATKQLGWCSHSDSLAKVQCRIV